MLDTFNSWIQIAKLPLHKTVDYVVTNHTVETAEPCGILTNYIHNNYNLKDGIRILDFGCGVGRNLIPLSIKYPNYQFYGYDSKQMFTQMSEFTNTKYQNNIINISNINLSDDWNFYTKEKFDLIYATLVFQHIYEEALKRYIQDIKNMTKTLYVYGRRWNDDSRKNTWEILENFGLYPVNTDFEKNGEDESHQLAIYQF